MSRTFFIGDIHGAHIALEQCLERSGFDREKDLLITAGDICDGWPYVYECVEILLTIKNRIDLEGNHDHWFRIWLKTHKHADLWWQGGEGTAKSYLRLTGREHLIEKIHGLRAFSTSLQPSEIPQRHRSFFRKQRLYHLDNKKRLFVHAGFEKRMTLKRQEEVAPEAFYWDRTLIFDALDSHFGKNDSHKLRDKISEIFIGHSSTMGGISDRLQMWGVLGMNELWEVPLHVENIWAMDTGAGWGGKLTIMDIDTHEYWQSDSTEKIYGQRTPRG
jgi:serine/threonine protein phosphatase 1